MHDGITVRAGECTTTFDGNRVRAHEQRGRMVAVIKPDNTVLVHDAEGYQPVAWLTRAESVTVGPDRIEAVDGDQRLAVECHDHFGGATYPASPAGTPVGDCPDCDGSLVHGNDAVTCPNCDARYGVPADAAVLTDEPCDCGLPRMRVERGREFEVCVDRSCESLDDAVAAAFDREWDCPNCTGELRVLRRGGLLAGCEHYPDCDTGFGVPTGTVDGECDCGLPAFATPTGRRCLDPACSVSQSL
jgi:DNA topoisomerase-1